MIAALLLVVAGMVLVRLGWNGRRSLAAGGWLLAAIGVGAAIRNAGAWGCAVAALVGMAVGLGAVLLAGWRAPVQARRTVWRTRTTAPTVRWPDVARRFAVFLLVVPVAAVAAEGLALAGRGFARGHGMGLADATVLAWLVQPVAWAAIMAVQMLQAGPARMIAPPLAAALVGAMLWGAA